jgi:hypothetical protein
VGQKVQPRANPGVTPSPPIARAVAAPAKVEQSRVEAKTGTPHAPKVAPAPAPEPPRDVVRDEPDDDDWEDQATRVQDVIPADVAKSLEATPAAVLPPVAPVAQAAPAAPVVTLPPAMPVVSYPPPMATAPPPMATAPPASMQPPPPNWIPPRTYNTAPPKSIGDVKTFVQMMIDDALDPIQRALEYNDRRIDQLERKILEMTAAEKNAPAAGAGGPTGAAPARTANAPLDPFGAVVVRPATATSAAIRPATTSGALREIAQRPPTASLNIEVPFDGNKRKRRVIVVFSVFLLIVFGFLFGMLGLSYTR